MISVRVGDDGPGQLQDTKTFAVVTIPKFRVVINEIMYMPSVANAKYIEVANAYNMKIGMIGHLVQGGLPFGLLHHQTFCP